LSRVTLQNGEEVDLWPHGCRGDEALALVLPTSPLSSRLPISKAMAAEICVREVLKALPQHRFVLKTDVRRIMPRWTTSSCWTGWRCILA